MLVKAQRRGAAARSHYFSDEEQLQLGAPLKLNGPLNGDLKPLSNSELGVGRETQPGTAEIDGVP